MLKLTRVLEMQTTKTNTWWLLTLMALNIQVNSSTGKPMEKVKLYTPVKTATRETGLQTNSTAQELTFMRTAKSTSEK